MEEKLTDRQFHQLVDVAPSDEMALTTEHPGAVWFPRLLRAFRLERGWSKSDLAKRAKFDPSTITRLEQGSREPERETVVQLAEAMAMPLPDRDRLLAAAGYRSDTWDDPDLVEIASLLADPSIPAPVRQEIRIMLRVTISHARFAKTKG